MARPPKIGLDYFPLDVSIEDNIELFEAECGLEGFAILIKLWQKIYSKGYYIEWGEDHALLFSRKINSGINLINSVVNCCLRRNVFDKTLNKKHNILTSSGIQKRYLRACSDCKRKNIPFKKEYILVDSEFTKLITELTRLTPEETPQRKGEDNKEEKNKIYRKIQHLNFSEKDNQKLLSEGYSQIEIDEILDRMENWAKLKNNKSAILTARTWLKNNSKPKFEQTSINFKPVEEKYSFLGDVK